MSSLSGLRRVVTIVAVAASPMLLLTGCGNSPTANGTTLAVSPASLVIPFGLTGNLRAIETSPDGGSRDVTGGVIWAVTPGIASVTSGGYLRSVSPGAATITATLGSEIASAALQVLAPRLQSAVHQPSKNQYVWFGPPAAEGEMRFFRSQFMVEGIPSQATLYVAGPRAATVFLNGNQVMAAAEQRPAWQVAYMGAAADVSGALKLGTNVLAIETEGGGQLAAMIVPAAQGIDVDAIAETGADWRGETTATAGWQDANFDDHSWGTVTVIGGIEDNPLNFEGNADMELYQWPGYDGISPWLAHVVVPVTAVLSTSGSIAWSNSGSHGMSGFTVQMPSEGSPPSLILDFGDELDGRLILVSQTPATVTAQIKYGESLDELITNPYLGVQTVVIPANGTAAGPKSGYRYAQATFTAGPRVIRLANLYSDKIYYPVSHLGSFDSSDELLNRIWQLAEKTIQVGMQEHIWDAPKRDRRPYSGDGYVIDGAIGHTFADRVLIEKTIDTLRTEAGSSDVNGIPGYDAMWVLMLADYYERYGDVSYLQTESGFLRSVLATMESEIGADGLFHFSAHAYPFFDWSQDLEPPAVTEGASIGSHLELILGFEEGAWLLQQLGDAAADYYSQLATQLQNSARQAFLDPATNTYGPYWQINAMAILSGTATPDQVSSIWDTVLSQPSQYWVTPFFNYFVLNAMTQAGHRKEALDLVRSYWGGMVNEGATCFWEGYDPSWPKDHFHLYLHADAVEGTFVSLCHGWGAGPISWLNTEIAGIKPLAPAFSSVMIRPDLFDLTHLKVVEPTPLGIISLDVRAPAFSTTINLPAGMTAQLSVPISAGQTSVVVNGRVTKGVPAEGNTRLIISLAGGTQYSVTAFP
jgi:alpha-L-rhamnosidase